MHAYIITGGNRELRLGKIHALADEFDAQQFDLLTLGLQDSPGIGIADVRDFQKSLALAPAYGKTRLGIINFADTLTLEAQQALLKTLEEPPPSAKIILETGIADSLLPTIISRCQLISLGDRHKYKEEEMSACLQALEQLARVSVGERLKKIEELVKTRDDAAAFIDLAIAAIRGVMLSSFGFSSTINSLDLLRRLLKAQRGLSANVNPKLVIDNVFLD